MNLPEATFAVLEEIKRMREEGAREIYLEDKTLNVLEHVLGAQNDGLTVVSDVDKQNITSLPNRKEHDRLVQNKAVISTKEEVRQEVKVLGVEDSSENSDKFLTLQELSLPEGDKGIQWEWLKNEMKNCSVSNTELDADGQIVFGRGNLDSELFFCGEAPSEDDEEKGLAFSGPSGQLLAKIIEAMGYSVSSVYITNILHWKPKQQIEFGHRPPTQSEVQFAMPFLKAQLRIIKPKVIIALGKIAADGFLGFDPKRRLGDVRGNWDNYEGFPIMVTYHPSYLLHNPSKTGKRKVWEDMLKVMEQTGKSISEKQLGFFL